VEIPYQYELLASLAQGVAMFNTRKCYLASQSSYHWPRHVGVPGTVFRDLQLEGVSNEACPPMAA